MLQIVLVKDAYGRPFIEQELDMESLLVSGNTNEGPHHTPDTTESRLGHSTS